MVCKKDEWCMLVDQLRFGPWGMASGETPNFGPLSCEYLQANNFTHLFSQVCRNKTDWGPWLTVRGRCVKYRQEQQSCKPYLGAANAGQQHLLLGGSSSSEQLGPQYVVEPKHGRPPRRPLLCAPGLVCTGDVEPVPWTCVKARPADTCYQGPWWDSTAWCRSQLPADVRAAGGLPRKQLEGAAQALIIQLPVEVYHGPSHRSFWEDPEAQRAREIAQSIVQALWPDAYRSRTRFPLPLPDPRAAAGGSGHVAEVGSPAWNSTAARAEGLYRQPNRVWSTIHTLVHNCADPMGARQVEASRSLAVWLRQHFMCCNCRGFWAADVLNVIGLPPETSDRETHKRWWWRAHNMVSEHSAATRGGHPWIFPALTDEGVAAEYGQYSELIRCQNRWFLPYEDAERMWTLQRQERPQQW